MMDLLRKWPEISFTVALAGLVTVVSWLFELPFNLPSGERAAFVGIHYLYPLLGLSVWACFALVGQRRALLSTFLVALPCYAAVLLLHFNLKLWIPHINPTLWDWLYWEIDRALRPLVLACFALRRALVPIVPLDSNLYMTAFIGMFYVSFCYHALRTPEHFRTLFLAALIFQGLGAIAYLLMPALGPFLYEPGLEPLQSGAQAGMLEAWRQNAANGEVWLAANGSLNFTAGVAAMPSLHTGGSFLFLLFAWRYGRVLVPLYILLFGFIAIDAIANRWHYLVDLPVGIALAFASAWLAERLTPHRDILPEDQFPEPVTSPATT
ncbi:phosphatase PAP2 family protein [Croceibacterium sp. LX-88]|uniref:Phosphatase PAP2 family protein n=1 Tax=Croceibacterium selenioxidans TaxID=2838833 RepID=A0ABS5W435_9SPHN|nr:phosphatase PAP2 family protein [Croceibacterium selenioxidans]MBT2134251.1 phosphatase PAP2 family protein [Croceibacterium selenioxidans]